MSGNKNLYKANRAKDDEFYTQRTDIEKELRYYKNQFENKIVYCNCDDPEYSHFFRYFADNFEHLKLKKLICTHYEKDKNSYALIIEKGKDKNKDGKINRADVEKIEFMFSNGDFRSDECIKFLKKADIVVTNPPFSLFREYVAQLMEYKKKFLIIGNKNALTYKEIFPLLKNNEVWLGYNSPSDFMYNGELTKKINGLTRWYTNLEIDKRYENLELYKKYNSEEYPKYDNYDAINVNKVSEIPMDYDGVMGVPITFLDKYNPEQFEIIGLERYTAPKEVLVGGRLAIKTKPTYARILIKKKKGN